jgi:thioredoxin-dependent peroxiredoxin
MIKVGEKAIEIQLNDKDGKLVKLSDFLGKKVVVYFYPKDDTPGCTIEACSFRDAYDELLEMNAVVIGISGDSTKSHINFGRKYNLPFYLLSDEDHAVTEAYGAWAEKSMFGKKNMGIQRATFIIDEKGMVAKVFPKVSPTKHIDEVIKALQDIK